MIDINISAVMNVPLMKILFPILVANDDIGQMRAFMTEIGINNVEDMARISWGELRTCPLFNDIVIQKFRDYLGSGKSFLFR